jgi:hypothetical protein
MTTTTTIRIDNGLKVRIAAAAERAGKTAHAFILDAIAQTVEQVELDEASDRIADAISIAFSTTWLGSRWRTRPQELARSCRRYKSWSTVRSSAGRPKVADANWWLGRKRTAVSRFITLRSGSIRSLSWRCGASTKQARLMPRRQGGRRPTIHVFADIV